MCTHNIVSEQNMKIVKKNQLKIVIFTAVKNRCILHGRVFVMFLWDISQQSSPICDAAKRVPSEAILFA